MSHWISVDGVEGAGKTTLVAELAADLDAVVVPEFSQSLIGAGLRAEVRTSPHFVTVSKLGQSLAFIGDFHETYEAVVVPALREGRTVISDRGWLSKYAYQAQVLHGTYDSDVVDAVLLGLLTLMELPDLTLLLDCDMSIIKARLIARDGSCDADRERFISGARDRYDHFLRMRRGTAPDLRVVRVDSADRELASSAAFDALNRPGDSTRPT